MGRRRDQQRTLSTQPAQPDPKAAEKERIRKKVIFLRKLGWSLIFLSAGSSIYIIGVPYMRSAVSADQERLFSSIMVGCMVLTFGLIRSVWTTDLIFKSDPAGPSTSANMAETSSPSKVTS